MSWEQAGATWEAGESWSELGGWRELGARGSELEASGVS